MAITYQAGLAREVREACGENASLCFQCRKCTAGCPLAEHFDVAPHRLLRAVQLGQRDTVLQSRTIWLCSACEACSTRCPQGISLPRIMDGLKMMALRQGAKPAVPAVPAFYASALRGIKLFGRMYEAGLMAELYLRLARSRNLDWQQLRRRDIPLALHMVRTGKLKLLPPLSRKARRRRATTQPATRRSIAYFPGCSLHGTAGEYDTSTRAVAARLDLELIEPDGWVCCGTTPAHSTDRLLATVMPLRSLARIEQEQHTSVTAPCPSCFIRLRTALADVAGDPWLQEQVSAQLNYTPSAELKVEHLLTTIGERVGTDAVRAAVTKPLNGLKVVCYYGCVVTRPPKLTGASNCEYPTSMDELMSVAGAEPLDWSFKTECCGASLSISQLPVALDLSAKVLAAAREAGAEAIAVACPMCHSNLDARQRQIAESAGGAADIPILYFTQLLGLSFGVEPRKLGLSKHAVSPEPLLRERGLWTAD